MSNLARKLFGVGLPHSDHLRGEAIMRLTETACAHAVFESAAAITGVNEVDEILRAYNVVSVEPVFEIPKRRQSGQALRRLYRILLEGDEDLRGLVTDLRNHPDVEAVTLRNIARTFG